MVPCIMGISCYYCLTVFVYNKTNRTTPAFKANEIKPSECASRRLLIRIITLRYEHKSNQKFECKLALKII